MKKIVPFLIFIISFSANAQLKISSYYSSVDIGRNISFLIEKQNNKISFGIGPKIFLNSLVHDNNSSVYRKRFYATSFKEHLGIELLIKYKPTLANWVLKPHFFYDLQVTKSHTRNRMFLPYTYDPITNDVLYIEEIVFFGPFTAFESNAGIGIEEKLFGNFCFSAKLGFGVALITGKDEKRPETLFRPFRSEFTKHISVGIGYTFKK